MEFTEYSQNGRVSRALELVSNYGEPETKPDNHATNIEYYLETRGLEAIMEEISNFRLPSVPGPFALPIRGSALFRITATSHLLLRFSPAAPPSAQVTR